MVQHAPVILFVFFACSEMIKSGVSDDYLAFWSSDLFQFHTPRMMYVWLGQWTKALRNILLLFLAGASIFQAIEGASEMERANNMTRERDSTADYLWQNITLALNLFNETELRLRYV